MMKQRRSKGKKRVQVAILLECQMGFCRAALSGIQRFAREKPDWVFHGGRPDLASLPQLRRWKPDGIIGHLYTREMYDAVRAMNVPLVITTRTIPGNEIPDVDVDHVAVGQIAAEYYLAKKYRNFAYFGSKHAVFSVGREAGFREVLSRHGFTVTSCHEDFLPLPVVDIDWRRVDTALEKWLKKVSTPLAVFASNDVAARLLADVCRRLGYSIPDEVAILGVDNDEYECELSTPHLSSVTFPADQVGYQASVMLDQLMRGNTLRQAHPMVVPVGVVSRQSTDYLAVSDSIVLRGLQFIRDHVDLACSVDAVCEHCSVSRRVLERHFRDTLQHSVLQMIHTIRMEQAISLLGRTRLEIGEVARVSGFSSARHMTDVFRVRIGKSPSRFRFGLSDGLAVR